MGHAHHPEHDHHHAPAPDADRRVLGAALALIATFMVAEVVAGLLADSLALLSDAAHMLTDAASLALALVAATLAARPVTGRMTFGWGRAEVLSAAINGAALVVLALVITIDAVRRLVDPPQVEGGIVLVVGVLGAVVNVAAAWLLARAQRQSLNVAGARAHVLADLYGSVAAITAGALVLAGTSSIVDPLASLVVVALMLRSGTALLRRAGTVLLEGAPAGLDAEQVGMAMAREPGVTEVHDLHLWEVTTGFTALAAHVMVPPDTDCHAVRRRLQAMLQERFALAHVTLQVEHGARDDDAPIQIATAPSPR